MIEESEWEIITGNRGDAFVIQSNFGEHNGTVGIPQTDTNLTRAFVLKSPSEETRRTYCTTLNTFAAFCEKRHGRNSFLLK